MSIRSLASASLLPPRAAGVLWEALVEDSGVLVVIVDADGVVRFSNDMFARIYADRDARAIIGLRIDQVLPPAMAQERLQVLRSVALSGKPVQLRSTWRGVRQRAFLRPLPARVEGRRAVLVVVRPELAGETENDGLRVIQAKHVDEGPLAALSPRERTVLSLIGEGMSTAQMAEKLGRSAKTIENQRYSLARKLGARNRVELARIALRAGLSTPAAPSAAERSARRRHATLSRKG